MAYLNSKERYGSLSITLHWLTFLALVGVYICVELHEYFPKGDSTRNALMATHFFLGLTVFILMVLRLIFRLIAPEPQIVPDILIWQKWLAKAMHWTLYIVMIMLPLMGYMGRSAAGRTTYFMTIPLPHLVAENKPLAETIFEFHTTIGSLTYILVGLHVLAALFHHYVQRDNTLTRMWFKRDI